MPTKPKFRNPFYPMLVVVGTLFAITAFAYGVMTLHALRASASAATAEPMLSETLSPLIDWLNQKGDMLLLAELGLLGLLTFAAIGTDGYWDREKKGPEVRVQKKPGP